MGYAAKKTGHCARKRGNGAYWGCMRFVSHSSPLPGVIIPIVAGNLEPGREQFPQSCFPQQLLLGPIPEHLATLQHDHAVDLGNNVRQMMRHQHNPGPGLRNPPQDLPQLVTGVQMSSASRSGSGRSEILPRTLAPSM